MEKGNGNKTNDLTEKLFKLLEQNAKVRIIEMIGSEIMKCKTPAEFVSTMISFTIHYLEVFFMAFDVKRNDREEIINEVKQKLDSLIEGEKNGKRN